jgi:hypothetical protein
MAFYFKKSQLLAEGIRQAYKCLRGAKAGFQNRLMNTTLW